MLKVKTVTKVAPTAAPKVDPTPGLKNTIVDLQRCIEDERAANRALVAQNNNNRALYAALSDGFRAERADLQARIDRIDTRLCALRAGIRTQECGSTLGRTMGMDTKKSPF